MAHLALINPPGIKTTSGLQMHTPNPPIGLAYIAAAARQAGHRVTVIDATGEALDQIIPMPARPDILVQGLTPGEVVARLPRDVDVVGLGCMFSTLWPLARQVLEAVRAARPELPIVVGGEHASAVTEHTLRSSPADVCVRGEGEETIVELLGRVEASGSAADEGSPRWRRLWSAEALRAVKGIAWLEDDGYVETPARERTRDIDAIPLPAWDLFPVDDYIDRQQMNGIHQGRAMPLLGTRGCPFRCTFCSSPSMWTTTYTMRDVGRVCDEIELYMGRYQATDFHFQDLTAIVSKKWIIAFCRELQRRGLRITWQLPSGTRSEAIDEEVCALLAATGCKNMAYAPESGSEELRELVEKRVKIEHLLASIRAALKHGLSLSCFFVIGFPQETVETLRATRRLIRKLALMGVQDVGVAKFVPYPGSAMFRDLLVSGKIALDDDFYLSPIDSYGGKGCRVSFAGAIPAGALHRWMLRLYLNFYLLSFMVRPWRVLGNVARAVFSGREDTRYARWVRDLLGTRRRWRRQARQRGPLLNVELPEPSAASPAEQVTSGPRRGVSLPVLGTGRENTWEYTR